MCVVRKLLANATATLNRTVKRFGVCVGHEERVMEVLRMIV
jgi:hypothetical protein